MQKYADSLSSKLPVFAAIITVVTVLAIGTFMRGSLTNAWHLFRIPSQSPTFTDTRSITHSIDCLAAGQDPYAVGTFDPFHRLFSYPPIWLQLRYLGVTSRSTNLIALIMSVITASAFLLLFRAQTWLSAFVVFFAVISRPVLFAVERGNIDQLIFSLLVFGFFLIDQQKTQLKPLLTGLLIVFLTILKVYPFVAAAVFIRRRNGLIKAALTATLSVAALALTSGRRLPLLFANTPRDYNLSFGSFPFFLAMSRHTFHATTPIILHHGKAAPMGAIILGVLSLIAAAIYSKQIDRALPVLDCDRARGCIAISCLTIFCFAFIFGSSYDYRLIFLLGALAYLVEDLNKSVSLRSLPAAILILLLLWGPFYLSLRHEIPDGLVFVMASAWLGNSLFRRTASRESAALLQTEPLKSI